MGFHADQEAARVLAESIDFFRQGQVLAQKLRLGGGGGGGGAITKPAQQAAAATP